MGRTEDGADPSAELLLWLFADRIVKRSRLPSRLGGTVACPVLGAPTLVRLAPLEQLLCSWALWGLQEGGALRLEQTQRLGRFDALHTKFSGSGGTSPLVEVVVDQATFADRSLGAELMEAAANSEPTAYSIVLHWATKDGLLPLTGVVRAVRAEAERAGVVVGAASAQPWWRRRSWNRVLPAPDVDAGRREALEPQFDELAGRWHTFGSDQAELRHGLLSDVRKALSAARPGFTSSPPPTTPGP